MRLAFFCKSSDRQLIWIFAVCYRNLRHGVAPGMPPAAVPSICDRPLIRGNARAQGAAILLLGGGRFANFVWRNQVMIY
jgi:hypothetical protein